MKAITLWEPWAWLIFLNLKSQIKNEIVAKKIETRSWKSSYRGEMAIHAAQKRFTEQEVYNKIKCELRALIKKEDSDTARELSVDRAISQLCYFEHGIPASNFGAVIGTVNLIDCVPIESLYGSEYDTPLERACGDWEHGRYGWILSNPKQFPEPIQAKGQQGFWKWDTENDIICKVTKLICSGCKPCCEFSRSRG